MLALELVELLLNVWLSMIRSLLLAQGPVHLFLLSLNLEKLAYLPIRLQHVQKCRVLQHKP